MTNTKTKRPMLKDLTKEDLIQMALTEPGTISNCYSLFHNYSVLNSWYLAMQQSDLGLEVTPVMSSSAWVKNGYITEETRRKINKIYAMVPQQWTVEKTDRNGKKVLDENGKPILISGTSFPFRQAFVSYSMINKKDLLKEFKPNYTVDFKSALDKMGMVEVKYGMVNGNCQGYCYPQKQEIAINPMAANAQKTMLHEIAHCILHTNDNEFIDRKDLTRSVKEAEAECTAYICSIMLGEDDETNLSYSRGYIQNWLGKGDETLKPVNVKRICKAVDIIMKALANYKDKYTNQQFKKELKELQEIKGE